MSKFSTLWRSEEWWAVWIGLLILGLVATGAITMVPKVSKWTSIEAAVKPLDALYMIPLAVGLLILTAIPVLTEKKDVKKYLVGFPVIFFLAFLSQLIADQVIVNQYGISYALWALIFGLVISNVGKTPKFLQAAAKSELFIKTGLVILGAEILFEVIMKAGARGLFEVTVGLALVWYFTYYLAVKLGLKKTFAAIMANATAVCGVSAAIAAGGAVKGSKEEISYVVSIVLLFAAPLTVIMPIIGRIFQIPDAIFGAWMGGFIDNTASVVATGALYSDAAMQVASIVKMSQNILIGITAFLLALYWVLKVERKPSQEKPKPVEIWYRFPKFIVGFLIASLVFSFVLVPTLGANTVDGLTKITKGFTGWFFALTFVSIGLQTNFRELIKIGKGKPLLVFLAATAWDMVLSLIAAIIFFSGMTL
jgi:uncharacterized membrane protein YadS